jgi:hypothetical protein
MAALGAVLAAVLAVLPAAVLLVAVLARHHLAAVAEHRLLVVPQRPRSTLRPSLLSPSHLLPPPRPLRSPRPLRPLHRLRPPSQRRVLRTYLPPTRALLAPTAASATSALDCCVVTNCTGGSCPTRGEYTNDRSAWRG